MSPLPAWYRPFWLVLLLLGIAGTIVAFVLREWPPLVVAVLLWISATAALVNDDRQRRAGSG